MYYVIGNSPKKVELKDLNDCIYYKQQKVYTDSQFERSVDLKRAIDRKILVVLKKSEDKPGSFDAHAAIVSSDIKAPEPVSNSKENLKIDALLDRIQELEKIIKDKPSSQDNTILLAILDRLERLEKSPTAVDMSTIQEALKGLEAKIQDNKDNKSEDILNKLEGIITRSGIGIPTISEENRRVEDIYVPNITVEDAKSHINLEVRKIDKGDSVSESLRKLKELKSKYK